jgi:hypothetical protein
MVSYFRPKFACKPYVIQEIPFELSIVREDKDFSLYIEGINFNAIASKKYGGKQIKIFTI